MAATPEAKVKARIKKLLAEYEVYYAMPVGSMYGNAGVPDFLCCVKGFFLAIEAKAGKGKTTALQDKHLDQIAAAGGTAMIVNENDLDGLEAVIRWMQTREVT